MIKKQFILFALTFLILDTSFGQKKILYPPKVSFLTSSYGDFLYFLFNRKEIKQIPHLDSLLGMQNVPKIDALIALPEIVTSARISSYKEIYAILKYYYKNNSASFISKPVPKKLYYSSTCPSYDTLLKLVRIGENLYPAFEKIWTVKIKPVEDDQIKAWNKQLIEFNVLNELYKITRLHLKSNHLDIACMLFHLAGSANYSPAGIYSIPFRKPDLGWFVGHEGTHLLLSSVLGNDWKNEKLSQKVINVANDKKVNPDELEESLCHFMQFTLSKAIHNTPIEEIIYIKYPDGLRKEIIKNMEEKWETYLKGTSSIMDIFLESSFNALKNYKSGDPI